MSMLISCLRFLWQEPRGSGHGTSVSARSPSRCAWLSRPHSHRATNIVIRGTWGEPTALALWFRQLLSEGQIHPVIIDAWLASVRALVPETQQKPIKVGF